MKRSDFLKKLGIGLGVAVVAPQVFAEKVDFTEHTLPKGTLLHEDGTLVTEEEKWRNLFERQQLTWNNSYQNALREPPYYKDLLKRYPATIGDCYSDAAKIADEGLQTQIDEEMLNWLLYR